MSTLDDMRAAESLRRAVPLVRQPSQFWPEPGQVTVCWLLGAVIFGEVLFLAAAIAWR